MDKITEQEIHLLAYYVSRYGVCGLGVEEKTLSELISKQIDLSVFLELLANYSCIHTKSVRSVLKSPKKCIEVHNKLKNKTTTQLRKIVLGIIDKIMLTN